MFFLLTNASKNLTSLLLLKCFQIDYIEHANNNTLKTVLALKYIFSVNWDGHYPEFVMKSDDDVYINIPLLSKLLFDSNDFK
jgi:hypothetical protein